MWYWVVGVVGLVWVSTQAVIPWAASWLLSYYVGTEVTLSAAVLRWEGGWQWRLRASRVQLRSTVSTLAFAPITAREAELAFSGGTLQAVFLEGVQVFLARTAPAQKNYRGLFPRRGRARSKALSVEAREVAFYLLNSPSQVEFRAFVPRVSGRLVIDSVSVSILDLKANLAELDLCYAGRSFLQRSPLSFCFAGHYDKRSDSWKKAFLRLEDSVEHLWFEGSIFRWARLSGTLQVSFRSARLPEGWQALAGRQVLLMAAIDTTQLVATAWGEGQWGSYRICGDCSGARCLANAWDQLEVYLEAPGRYQLYGYSANGRTWQVKGRGWYKGYPWQGVAFFDARERAGEATLQIADLRLWYKGSLIHGVGRLEAPDWIATFSWQKEKKLSFFADSLTLVQLRAFLGRYRELLQGGAGTLAWTLHLRRLSINSLWVVEALQAKRAPRDWRLRVEGRLRHTRWDTSARGWASLEASGQMGEFGLKEISDRWGIWGTWQGDSIQVSASGLLLGRYVGALAGYLHGARLWLKQLSLSTPEGGCLNYQGNLSLDSANGQIEGEVPLSLVLALRPISGLYLVGGQMGGVVCVSEPWSDFLSLDNHTEGHLRFRGVRGRFLKPDLPFWLEAEVHYDQTGMRLTRLGAQIAEFRLEGRAFAEGTLSYLYEDWRRLRGQADISVWNFDLGSVWRVRERERFRPRVLLPSEMELSAHLRGYDVDILGYRFDSLQMEGRLQDQLITITKAVGLYQQAHLRGRGLLDAADTSCYLAGFEVSVERLDLGPFLEASGLLRFPAIANLQLAGHFSGQLQAALRFSPTLAWRQNSTLMAKGQIYRGYFHTPPFLKWLRPFYIAAYRDSMDFIADIPNLVLKDGHLTITEALLFTRLGIIQVDGTHLLAKERFFYRFQAARLYRKAQRYSTLADLLPYVKNRLRVTLWILYLEKNGHRTRWIYPYKYVLRQLF